MKLMPRSTTDDGVDLFIWGNAESCVTIIAASIPILRVFVREAHTSAKKYYVSAEGGTYADQRSKKSGRGGVQSRDNTTLVASTQHSRSARRNGDDDLSDKSILGGLSHDGKHIVQTNEVAVEYEMGYVPRK